MSQRVGSGDDDGRDHACAVARACPAALGPPVGAGAGGVMARPVRPEAPVDAPPGGPPEPATEQATEQATGQAPRRRHRLRPPRRSVQVVLLLVITGVAVHVLLPQVGELHTTLHTVAHAHAAWLALAAVAVAATFPASAVSVIGAAGAALPLGRTTAVELGAAFLNRLTPGGLGRAGLLGRYLDRAGIDRLAIAGIVGVNIAAGAVVHVAALVAVAAAVRPGLIDAARLPDRWADLLTVLAVLVGVGLAVAAVLLRRRWAAIHARLAPLRAQLASVATQPRSLLALIGGVALVNALMVAALQTSLVAFGAHPAVLLVALVYLGGSAVAAVAPTPGGLGAMEAALVAGLTGLGVAAGPAVAGVLAFRLLSWWLPAGVGAAVWARLHRRQVL